MKGWNTAALGSCSQARQLVDLDSRAVCHSSEASEDYVSRQSWPRTAERAAATGSLTDILPELCLHKFSLLARGRAAPLCQQQSIYGPSNFHSEDVSWSSGKSSEWDRLWDDVQQWDCHWVSIPLFDQLNYWGSDEFGKRLDSNAAVLPNSLAWRIQRLPNQDHHCPLCVCNLLDF